MLPCRIEDNVFQTVVWTMDRPGKPQVTLIAECHVGSLEYFQGLNKILGETTPQVWAGIEGLIGVKDEGVPKRIRRRLELIRHEMALRSELAPRVGLVTRRDVLTKDNRTVVGLAANELVGAWGFLHSTLLRVMNSKTQKLIDRCNAGDSEAMDDCRSQVVRRFKGHIRFFEAPKRVERSILEDAKWNSQAFMLMTEELENGREGRLLMGALHIMALRRLMEREGYKVSSEDWRNCADLAA